MGRRRRRRGGRRNRESKKKKMEEKKREKKKRVKIAELGLEAERVRVRERASATLRVPAF